MRVRRIVIAAVLATSLAACGFGPPAHDTSPSGAMAHMAGDLLGGSNGECVPEVWVTGVIVPTEFGGAGIRDDQGVVRGLVWGSANEAVVDWGRRYTIGGMWFNTDAMLWACAGADAVIPQ